MSQIQLHHNSNAATGTSSALSALGSPASSRKDGGATSSQAFSQLLNQSKTNQQLQTKAPQAQSQALMQSQSTPTSSPTGRSATQIANAKAAAAGNAVSNTAQEENKLAARNAANRNAANRSAANHDADAPKAPAKQPQAQSHADGADKAQSQSAAKTHAKSDSDKAGKSDKADKADKSEKAEKATAQDDSAAAQKTAAADPAAAAQQMMAMLRGDAPQDPKLALKDGASLADGGAADGHAVGGHGKGGHHAGGMGAEQQLQQELEQASTAAVDGKSAGTGADSLEGMQALAGGSKELALGDAKHTGGTHQSFESLLAAAQADATGGASAADQTSAVEAPSVPLSQPLDSPDFAPELSASVSLLIQEGIHEAQLQLNPTDMGPVAIQIQLDGQQAQVNFHAEQAATRDVLMRSMPDLAAALQSQGLTLSGGGVFAQPQSSGNGQSGQGSQDGGPRRGLRGGNEDEGIGAVSRAAPRSQPRGLVDLYA